MTKPVESTTRTHYTLGRNLITDGVEWLWLASTQWDQFETKAEAVAQAEWRNDRYEGTLFGSPFEVYRVSTATIVTKED